MTVEEISSVTAHEIGNTYANAGHPYGPIPKETASGKVIPMPKRKAI